MDDCTSALRTPTERLLAARPMVPAELNGKHIHVTPNGNVWIYRRGDTYLARGRFHGQVFGQSLSSEEDAAERALRRLLVELEDGTFLRPSEARRRALRVARVVNITIRQLCDDYVAEKRKTCGDQTAKDYKSRLMAVLDFFEQKRSLVQWPIAERIDREAVIELKAYLVARQVTRNGRAGGTVRPMSPRQIHNCLDQLRQAIAWGLRTDVRKLPVEYANPVTADIIGPLPTKDPLRAPAFPLNHRLQMVDRMDAWQIVHLWIALILPLRPEGIAGLLISDVDTDDCTLLLGSRFAGNDFSKGGTTIRMPFPPCFKPLVAACAGARAEGPLFRSRLGCIRSATGVHSRGDLEQRFHEELACVPDDVVQTVQDRKSVLRKLLRQLGGISEDQIAKELRKVLPVDTPHRPYELRASITQEMKAAGIHQLELRYLTEHSVSDILNQYTGLDPAAEMGKYFNAVKPLLDAIMNRAAQLQVI